MSSWFIDVLIPAIVHQRGGSQFSLMRAEFTGRLQQIQALTIAQWAIKGTLLTLELIHTHSTWNVIGTNSRSEFGGPAETIILLKEQIKSGSPGCAEIMIFFNVIGGRLYDVRE